MSKNQSNQKLLDAVTETLDKSCDSLDGQTLSRLNKIRHEALELPQQSWNRRMLAPFGGFVAASAMVVMMFSLNVETPTSDSSMEDLEIMVSSDSLEFYEDFEFYQWLEDNGLSA